MRRVLMTLKSPNTSRSALLVVTVVLLAAASCGVFRGTQERVADAIVGRPVSVLRGCAASPEIESVGEVELQLYTWVLSDIEDPFGRDRPLGAPRGVPLPQDREEAVCTLRVEVGDGKIERSEISGKLVFEGDYTSRCAAVLLRCLGR